MRTETLDLLRCPFCGTRLAVVDNPALDRTPTRIEAGVLGCACCAFPVVAGIPVLLADDAARAALQALEAGRSGDALRLLLGLDGARRAAFDTLIDGNREPTYRDLLGVLCRDAEADYLLHRFSDPTWLLAEALIDALGAPGPPQQGATAGRALDLCGGSGHLTRVLLRQPACAGAVVADVHFWKLWLAVRIVAPNAEPVCCDANSPLPFADGAFTTVLLSDAFPYIWHKRLLAGEMQRAARRDGVVLMPHLHSAHGENHSAGDTLSPTAYHGLFAPLAPRLFDDRRLLAGLLDDRAIDLARHTPPAGCGDTPSVTLVASRNAALYRRCDIPDRAEVSGVLAVNPLYRVDHRDGASRLTLAFPSPEYEEEFALAKRYLPAAVSVPADLRGTVDPAAVGPLGPELRRRRVLLDLPPRYC